MLLFSKPSFLFILFSFLFSFGFLSACTNEHKTLDEQAPKRTKAPAQMKIAQPETIQVKPKKIDRTSILKKLKEKTANGQPLVAHLFIPLCDNEHQGIVKVNKNLGDGMNLRSNLYWGALYGLKTHFKKHKSWALVYEKKSNTNILERVVFRKKNSANTVYLIADAYRGDRMKACLEDYLDALSGQRKDDITIPEVGQIPAFGGADLVGFSGHNGLMDVFDVAKKENKDGVERDALIVGCVSFPYFSEYMQSAHAFPLLTTNSLMAPEAYILEAALSSWANLVTEKEVRQAAAKAYHKYQKCGMKGALGIFKSGW